MHTNGGAGSAGGRRGRPTIYELNSRGRRRSAREIPRLVGAAIALCWRAGRRELITMGVLELLSGAGVAAQVVELGFVERGQLDCARHVEDPVLGVARGKFV